MATTKIPQSQALAIPLTPCTSRQVASFGYDADTSTLAMQFHQGEGLSAVYQYPNVPKETYDGLCAHESKGKYFGLHIKSLDCRKVVSDEEFEKSQEA